MLCSSCKKQKKDIHLHTSRLIKSMKLYYCNKCELEKLEPRFVIILAGRSQGMGVISDYLKRHRYLGDEITAKELT
jgi:NAD-dependent SIR2 family protein deacetylase